MWPSSSETHRDMNCPSLHQGQRRCLRTDPKVDLSATESCAFPQPGKLQQGRSPWEWGTADDTTALFIDSSAVTTGKSFICLSCSYMASNNSALHILTALTAGWNSLAPCPVSPVSVLKLAGSCSLVAAAQPARTPI